MLKEKAIIERMKKVGKRDFPTFKDTAIKPDSKLDKDATELNSMEMVQFILALEDEFSCQIPDDVITDATTVGDIIKYLKKTGK